MTIQTNPLEYRCQVRKLILTVERALDCYQIYQKNRCINTGAICAVIQAYEQSRAPDTPFSPRIFDELARLPEPTDAELLTTIPNAFRAQTPTKGTVPFFERMGGTAREFVHHKGRETEVSSPK
jgi:hypothetical protein